MDNYTNYINKMLQTEKVRLLVETKEENKVLTLEEAIKLSEEQGLDLICINSNSELPVVKICDSKKYEYEQKKKAKENAKKAKMNSQDTKEIQITESTADNDLKTKAKHIDRFLKDNDKVKLSIRYKGRSIRNIAGGESKLNHLLTFVTVEYKVDKQVRTEGNTVSVTLAPIK